jgi:1-aminocyclopropane-1-carboxylate deaminase/D-cysteine desulfhydrase-like pyridoxal-dependent ACC family enzyme
MTISRRDTVSRMMKAWRRLNCLRAWKRILLDPVYTGKAMAGLLMD